MGVKSLAEAGEQNATATAAHPTNSLFIGPNLCTPG